MGYKSEIVIGIKKKIFIKHCILIKDIPKLLLKKNTKYIDNNIDGNYFWTFKEYKWNSYYPKVKEVDKFLEKLSDKNYGFLRMGEGLNDIESKGSPWDFGIYINDSINFPLESI